MTVLASILISITICVFAAILEGICAGKNVKEHFATLRFPAYSAPLPVWYVIGGIYYLVFGFLIYRMLRAEGGSPWPSITLGLIVFMMVANGLWNYVFFRSKNLYAAFVTGSIAPAFDVALLVLVLFVDANAALAMVPYLLYRIYAVWWGYSLWRANS